MQLSKPSSVAIKSRSGRHRALSRAYLVAIVFFLGLGLLLATSGNAQPFESWLVFETNEGRVEIPHHAAQNPSDEITIEGWISVEALASTQHIIQKLGSWDMAVTPNNSFWAELFLEGGSVVIGSEAEVPNERWTHFATTYDGHTMKLYLNGELVASEELDEPLDFSSDASILIGTTQNSAGDVFDHLRGGLNEIRLWNVARTQEQIRTWLNQPIRQPRDGLIAVWSLRTNGTDEVGPHSGSLVGNVHPVSFPAVADCLPSTDTAACLQQDRFQVTVDRREPVSGSSAPGQVEVSSSDTAIFSFFDPANWELMVKVLKGCGITDHYWVYTAATTDVFYRLEVRDVLAGRQKIYFNYAGEPAPAVTDSSAFDTCP